MSFADAFQAFPQLETQRLLLRSLRPSDVESFFHHFSTLRASPFWGLEHEAIEETRKYIEGANDGYRNRRFLLWAITTLKNTKIIVGSVFLRDFGQESKAEIGYWLSTEYRGKGLMTEAVEAVVKYSLEVMELHRIQATSHPENGASIQVLQKTGFQQEGRLRESTQYKDGWGDSFIFSILKRDYEK